MGLHSLLDRARRFGPAPVGYALAVRAADRAFGYRAIEVVRLRLDELREPDYLTPDDRYRGSFLSPAEIASFARDPALRMATGFVESALERGDRCYGLVRDGRLASYGWYAARETPAFDDLLFTFDPAWLYMYKGYTLPEHRGERLHGIGMARALAAATEGGRQGLVSWVESTNTASLRSCRRLGYVALGTIRLVGRDPLRRIFTPPACRRADVGLRLAGAADRAAADDLSRAA